MQFKNTFGAATSDGSLGIDIQRSDLFHVELQLPGVLGGVTAWDQNIAFAIEKFPFPERSREMVPVKYLNQTNYQPGADTATPSVNLTVRYAFTQSTFTLLEQWHWLTSNPITGSVGLASQIKTNGSFWWLIPVQPTLDSSVNASNSMVIGGAYFLEGCMVKGFKPADADMTTSNGLVTAEFGLQIDRYYPLDPADLQVTSNAPSSGGLGQTS